MKSWLRIYIMGDINCVYLNLLNLLPHRLLATHTEEGTEKEEKWDHGLGFISYLTRSGGRAKSMIPHIYGVLATNNSIDGQMRSPDCRETSGGILVTFEKGSTQPIPLFLQAPSEVWRKPFDAPAAEFNRK